MTAPHTQCQPGCATPCPWKISEVRSVEGEYLIVGGEGQDFGLIASVTEKADAELIVTLQDRVEELTKALLTIVNEYGPNHGSRYCFQIAVDALKADRAIAPSLEQSGSGK